MTSKRIELEATYSSETPVSHEVVRLLRTARVGNTTSRFALLQLVAAWHSLGYLSMQSMSL